MKHAAIGEGEAVHDAPAHRISLREVVEQYEDKLAEIPGELSAFKAAHTAMNAAACIGGTFGERVADNCFLHEETVKRALLKSAWKHTANGLQINRIASAKARKRLAGFFAQPGFELPDLRDMKGKSMAFGDVNSSSSFTIQVGMLIKAGVDPARDLSKIFLTGGHANSLNALTQGHVDVSAASFNSYQKAVNQGAVNTEEAVPVARSVPIPYPPFIMLPTLSEDIKKRLRNGFDTVHDDPNITPEMIRGFGGILVDRYTSDISHETFAAVQEMLDLVTDEVKGEMLKRASEN